MMQRVQWDELDKFQSPFGLSLLQLGHHAPPFRGVHPKVSIPLSPFRTSTIVPLPTLIILIQNMLDISSVVANSKTLRQLRFLLRLSLLFKSPFVSHLFNGR